MNGYLVKICLLLVVTLSGCSVVEVSKVIDGSEEGQRYSLPVVAIVVNPDSKGDGSYKVETKFLPDDQRTYAIDGYTVFGSNQLVVETSNGLLTNIKINIDDTSVVTEAFKALIQAEKFKRDEKIAEKATLEEKNVAAITKKEEEKKALLKTFEDAKKALVDKELEIVKKEAEKNHYTDIKNTYQSGVSDSDKNKVAIAQDAIEKIQLEFVILEIDRTSLEQKMEGIKSSSEYQALNNILNQAGASGSVDSTKIWGPAMYVIKDTYNAQLPQGGGGAVSLVPVIFAENSGHQIEFNSVRSPTAPDLPEDIEQPVLQIKDPNLISFGTPGQEIEGTFDKKISIILPKITFVKEDFAQGQIPMDPIDVNLTLDSDNKKIILTILKGLDKGFYSVQFGYMYEDSEDPVQAVIRINAHTPPESQPDGS